MVEGSMNDPGTAHVSDPDRTTPRMPGIVFFEFNTEALTFAMVKGDPEALLGIAVEDWTAPGFLKDLVPTEDFNEVRAFLEGFREDGGVRSETVRFLSAPGDIVTVRLIAVGYGKFGRRNVRGVFYRFANGSGDRDRVRQLVLDVTTEFAQPINEISGYAALLGQHLSRQGDDLGSDYALGIRDGVERLRGLVEQMNASAREIDPKD